MALTLTVVGQISHGQTRKIYGTFTGVAGDNSATFSGFDKVTDYELKFDGEIQGQNAKFAFSAPTATWTFDDLAHATTGNWVVEGT